MARAVAMTTCPRCGHVVADRRFCGHCGEPLDGDGDGAGARRSGSFAAAPGERVAVPWAISTLFPHLPQASARSFRLALAAGVAVVLVLGALGLFPVALLVAAIVVPLLTLLYVYDADVFEDAPLPALACTAAWGMLAGVAVAELDRLLLPSGSVALVATGSGTAVRGSVVLPLIAYALALAGPVALLPHRRFNDVLDGATFGVASASGVAGAQVLAHARDLFSAGSAPVGATVPWLGRLLTVAVAGPVLTMSVVGAASAALWLRFRAPVADRDALGAAGRPLVVVPAGAAGAVLGALGQQLGSVWLWLAELLVLGAAGLSLLRRAIHLGLLQERAELQDAPSIACANCGRQTPRRSFCAECGMALAALPKGRGQQASDGGARRPLGDAAPHLSRRRLLAATGATLVLAVALGSVAVAALAPPLAARRCIRGRPCSPPELGAPLVNGTVWRSAGLGYQLEYAPGEWSVVRQDGRGITLRLRQGEGYIPRDVTLTVVGVRHRAGGSPRALLDAEVARLADAVFDLTPDPSPARRILGPALGYRPGVGATYGGTVDVAGVRGPVTVLAMAAGDRQVDVAATAASTVRDPAQRQDSLRFADSVLNTIRWSARA